VDRLDQELVGPRAQATDLLLHVHIRGQHDDREMGRLGLVLADPLGYLVPVEPGEVDIEQDQGRLVLDPQLEAGGAIGRGDHLVVGALERRLDASSGLLVGIDDEDRGRHHSVSASCKSLGSGGGEGATAGEYSRRGGRPANGRSSVTPLKPLRAPHRAPSPAPECH